MADELELPEPAEAVADQPEDDGALKQPLSESMQQLEEQHSEAPPVHGPVVPVGIDQLRGEVVRYTAGREGLVGWYDHLREPEVGELHFIAGGDEDVEALGREEEECELDKLDCSLTSLN